MASIIIYSDWDSGSNLGWNNWEGTKRKPPWSSWRINAPCSSVDLSWGKSATKVTASSFSKVWSEIFSLIPPAWWATYNRWRNWGLKA